MENVLSQRLVSSENSHMPRPLSPRFRFIDLFSGIGGIRMAFEKSGFDCVFSSEWDRHARETYHANFGEMPAGDIRAVRAPDIPEFDFLTAGFPCQPFSIAGVSKKNALGRTHGFLDRTQGTLFFEIARILRERRPSAFLLENVRNLASHDGGRTLRTILDVLQGAGYAVEFRTLSSRAFVPQKRVRIFLVGFLDPRRATMFQFPDDTAPGEGPRIGDILEERTDRKYILTDHLWKYLRDYKEKHRREGNGFGFGLVGPDDVARTLSARYYKDGSEILVRRGSGNPRRLTPRECARLMGFPDDFRIVVSDTQAYKQFGNSVVVPLVQQIAMKLHEALAAPLSGRIPEIVPTAPQLPVKRRQKSVRRRIA